MNKTKSVNIEELTQFFNGVIKTKNLFSFLTWIMYLGNQNIFLLLMRYIFGVHYEWKIFTFQLFPKFLLSFSTHSCDTSALEVGKRNKACILKTAGIEVHLLLQKDVCQAYKKDANLLWWTGPPTLHAAMPGLILWKPSQSEYSP